MPVPTAINSISVKRSLLFLAPLALVSCSLAHSQESAPATKNYVHLAQEFLVSLYPDLAGKGYVMSLEASFRYDVPMNENTGFDLYVGRGPKGMVVGYLGGYMGQEPPKKKLQSGLMTAEQFLISSFLFNNDGKLTSFGVKGPAVGNPDKDEEVTKLAFSPPYEMTDTKAVAALKQAGARYGPTDKDEFVKHLPIDQLRRYLGPLNVISVEFPILDEHRTTRWPRWHVLAKVENGSSAERTYEMWLEPFKGDLVRLSLVPAPTNAGIPKRP
jgi:hypothetical protein